MNTFESITDASSMKIEPPVKAEAGPSEGVGVGGLFKAGDVESLLRQRDNPEAQLAAVVLMSNRYRIFNVRRDDCLSWLGSVDMAAASQVLGLDAGSLGAIRSKRASLVEAFSRLKHVDEERRALLDRADGRGGSREQHQERARTLAAREGRAEAAMNRTYRELMLPIREAVLASRQLPEEYKLHVVEGIKGHGAILEGEDALLKQCYPKESAAVRRQIADAVLFNVGHDLNAFEVIPPDDLRASGEDADALFIATLGNPQITGDFVEHRVAPVFFPNEDPATVRRCWTALREVTALGGSYRKTSFFSDGYNHHTNLMNVRFFAAFMENAAELIPVVSALSEYGFRYLPVAPVDGGFYPEYIARLRELGGSLEELKSELNAIRAVVPDYRYRVAVGVQYPETKDDPETYVETNPFSIALKQEIYPHGLKTDNELNRATRLFASLQKIVPLRWRGEFITTYVEMMSAAALYQDRPKGITRRAVAEAGRYAFEVGLTPDEVELFATKFFEASLDPRNENVRAAFMFCERYADRVRTLVDGSKRVDAASTWYKFSLLASDLYRYPIVAGKEAEAVNNAKGDIMYAIGAISRITTPEIRDKAILNLIYALTDEEIGDSETAQSFLEIIEDEHLKEDGRAEIQLEVERVGRGETTTWKKMEKVRRASGANTRFLEDLFGYGSAEALQTAQTRYRERTGAFPDWPPAHSDEQRSQLEREVDRVRDNFRVTVNITWANVLKTLEGGRVISVWENPEVMEYRNTAGKYHYGTRRDIVEKLIGNRAKGGMRDPHPIYAAAATPNGRDELYGGTGGGYGECFLVLKTDRIKDRTSFCYGDSFGDYNHWVLDWDGGVSAKAIHNLRGGSSRQRYVEAQVLGGIALDDIESINIPSDAIRGENKYGWAAGVGVLYEVEELQQKHPGIKINIIEV